jgi:hypothetical protein
VPSYPMISYPRTWQWVEVSSNLLRDQHLLQQASFSRSCSCAGFRLLKQAIEGITAHPGGN